MKDEYNRLYNILPNNIKNDLDKLLRDRDNELVSVEEWNIEADVLMARGRNLNGSQKMALIRCIKILGKEERKKEKEIKKIEKERLKADSKSKNRKFLNVRKTNG